MIRFTSAALIAALALSPLALAPTARAQDYTPSYPQGQTASELQTQQLQQQQQQQQQLLQQQQQQRQQNLVQQQSFQRQQQLNALSASAQGRPFQAQTYVAPSSPRR